MADAEYLTLQLALATGDEDVVVIADPLDQLSGIQALRRLHGGHHIGGKLGIGKQRQAQRLNCCTGGLTHLLMAAVDSRQ